MLAVLEQNPEANWAELVGAAELERETAPLLDDGGDGAADEDPDDLASFRL